MFQVTASSLFITGAFMSCRFSDVQWIVNSKARKEEISQLKTPHLFDFVRFQGGFSKDDGDVPFSAERLAQFVPN